MTLTLTLMLTLTHVLALSSNLGSHSVQESSPAKPLRRQPPEYYQYQLKGVVVHSGTAFAGHYYSYIKARFKFLTECTWLQECLCSSVITNTRVDDQSFNVACHRDEQGLLGFSKLKAGVQRVTCYRLQTTTHCRAVEVALLA